MTNTQNNDTDSTYESLLSFFNLTSIGLLYQLSPHFLDKENQAILEDLVGKAKVEVIGFIEEIEAAKALNQRIEQWRSQETDPKHTRVIVKIKNNTAHVFKISQTTLPLGQADFDTFEIPDDSEIAFKSEFAYEFTPPHKKGKIMFNHFIDFMDQDICIRFDLGMIMNSSFGLFTPTLKPTRKSTVTSIGKSKLNCSSRITSTNDDAPCNFEVEITLG